VWIFLPNSFLSIVQKPGDGDMLTVRGRIQGDIHAVFPNAEVISDAGTDYRFRARVPREEVARALADQVLSLSYSNFKATVRDRERHDTYLGVWDLMYQWQTRARRAETLG